nr:hypothetical protein OG999_34935 [Streptomyces sp. NBC_00886]
MAGERSFERGQGYRDAVRGLEVENGWYSARVQGGETYEVELAVDPEDGLYGEVRLPVRPGGQLLRTLCRSGSGGAGAGA